MMCLNSYSLVQRGMPRRLVNTSCSYFQRRNYDAHILLRAMRMVNIPASSRDSKMDKVEARRYVIFPWNLVSLSSDLLDILLSVKVIRLVLISVPGLVLHRYIFRHDRVLSAVTDRSRYLSMVYEHNKINSTWIKSLIFPLSLLNFHLVSIYHAPRANHLRRILDMWPPGLLQRILQALKSSISAEVLPWSKTLVQDSRNWVCQKNVWNSNSSKKHIQWICFLVTYFVIILSISRDQRSFKGNIFSRIRTISSLFCFGSGTNDKIRFSIFSRACFIGIGLSIGSITSWSFCSRWIEYFCWTRHVFKNTERNTTRRIFS